MIAARRDKSARSSRSEMMDEVRDDETQKWKESRDELEQRGSTT